VRVWAIASNERSEDDARQFADALQLQMPVLYDADGAVHELYVQAATVPAAAFPQEWIVGTDGTIVYSATQYEYAAVRDVIEAQLSGE
jgi:peroxiredoxin